MSSTARNIKVAIAESATVLRARTRDRVTTAMQTRTTAYRPHARLARWLPRWRRSFVAASMWTRPRLALTSPRHLRFQQQHDPVLGCPRSGPHR